MRIRICIREPRTQRESDLDSAVFAVGLWLNVLVVVYLGITR